MKHVSLQPRPLVLQTKSGAPLLGVQEMQAFSSRLSLRECQTVDQIVAAEAVRRGFGRPHIGGRIYCALEEVVVTDVIALELDLSEIGAQIEEARWEQS